MSECDAFGMEVEALVGCAVEDVALDGTVEPFGVGAVDAQLMGASCLWKELDAVGVDEAVVCNCLFPNLMIYGLTR